MNIIGEQQVKVSPLSIQGHEFGYVVADSSIKNSAVLIGLSV
jgi:hypothetical protein